MAIDNFDAVLGLPDPARPTLLYIKLRHANGDIVRVVINPDHNTRTSLRMYGFVDLNRGQGWEAI